MSINNSVNTYLNPLNVLRKRKINYLPLHFKFLEIDMYQKNKIDTWITNKLYGRYCIVDKQSVDGENRVRDISVVGFEDEKELTYFVLACPFLRRN